MSRSLLVSRTSLSLSDLQVWNPGVFTILGDSFEPGQQTLRREVATGPYTAGRILIGSVLDVQVAQLQVEVGGTSGSDLNANIGILLAAFSQPTYTVAASFDGLAVTWRCEPADYDIPLEDVDLVHHTALVVLSIPRSPVPSAGTF